MSRSNLKSLTLLVGISVIFQSCEDPVEGFSRRLKRSVAQHGVSMHSFDYAIKETDSTEVIVRVLWDTVNDPGAKAEESSVAANALHLLIIDEWKLPPSSVMNRNNFLVCLEQTLADSEAKGQNLEGVRFFRDLVANRKNWRRK